MQKKTYKLHDGLFKDAFSHLETGLFFLKLSLPESLQQELDLNTLEVMPTNFLSSKLEQLDADILYRCKTKDSQEYSYINLEHQSTIDKKIAFRLLQYNVQISRKHYKTKGNTKLPRVINVCLYAGKGLIEERDLDLDSLYHSPQSKYRIYIDKPILFDLNTAYSQEQLFSYGTNAMILILLKQGIERNFLNWVETYPQIYSKLKYTHYFETGTFYILNNDNTKNEEKLLEALKNACLDQKTKIMTVANRIHEKGIQQGMQQGMQQGIIDTAKNMIRAGLSIDQVKKITGLDEKKIADLTAKKAK